MRQDNTMKNDWNIKILHESMNDDWSHYDLIMRKFVN